MIHDPDATAAAIAEAEATTDPSPTPVVPIEHPDHPDNPLAQVQSPDQVPDNPSTNAVAATDPDPSIALVHAWDAGTCGFDIGPIKVSALDDEWRKAQADEHGSQETHAGEPDMILVPAHLREIEDTALATAKAWAAQFGADDEFVVRFGVNEADGDVDINLTLERSAVESN